MSGNYILAVDQGTSSTKAMVFGRDGSLVVSASRALDTRYNTKGWAEQDPDALYKSVVDAVGDVIEKLEYDHHIQRGQVACAGIANQRETALVWDAEGKPLYPAVVWQCKRSVSICSELKEAGCEPEIRARTGLIIDPYFSGTKLTWLRRNHKPVRAALSRGEAFFGTVDTWLLYRLTGGAVYATDTTNASRTLLFNIKTLSWDTELLRLLDLTGLRTPSVRPSSHEYGTSDFGGVFPKQVPITAMIGDSHSAFFGERCFETGDAKATLGTGCSVLLHAGNVAPLPYTSTMSTIGFSIPGRLVYALEGIIVSAGSVLTWLQRELGLFSRPEALEQAALKAGNSHGVVLVPGHAGMGAPFWRMDVQGSIHGLTFGTTSEHILRAALESIPYQVRAIIDAIRLESGVACNSIRADGGISRNGFVTRWMANTLGVPVHAYAVSEVTGLGAAFLAGLGAGIYSGLEEIRRLSIDEAIHEPDDEREAAGRGYAMWRDTVNRNLEANNR